MASKNDQANEDAKKILDDIVKSLDLVNSNISPSKALGISGEVEDLEGNTRCTRASALADEGALILALIEDRQTALGKRDKPKFVAPVDPVTKAKINLQQTLGSHEAAPEKVTAAMRVLESAVNTAMDTNPFLGRVHRGTLLR